MRVLTKISETSAIAKVSILVESDTVKIPKIARNKSIKFTHLFALVYVICTSLILWSNLNYGKLLLIFYATKKS